MVDVAAETATGDGYAYNPAALTNQTGQVGSDLIVEWDFDNDGDLDQAVENISSYVIGGDYRVGRDYPSQLLGRSTPGSMRLTLDNTDNRFSYYNTSSPVNTGNYSLKNGRRIRLRTSESSPSDPDQLARDRFAGSGDMNTSTTEDGETWSTVSGSMIRSGGRAVTTGTPATPSIAVVDVGVNDYYAQVTIPYADYPNTVGLVFRYSDTSNYEVVFPLYTWGFRYFNRVAGVESTPNFRARDFAGSITLGIEVVGSTGTVYIAGVPFRELSLVGTTGSKVGLYGFWAAQRAPTWDEFAVWDTVRSPQDGVLWSGTVTSCTPNRNQRGEKTAVVIAEGDMARLDRTVSTPTSLGASENLTVGKTTGQSIGETLASVGMLHPPLPLDAGDLSTGGVGALKQKAINAVRKFEDAEVGFVYEPPEGGIAFDARSARDRATPVATFTDSPVNATEIAPESVTVRTSMRDIVNRVTSEVSPTLPRIVQTFGNGGDAPASTANDITVIIPNSADGATAGDLVLVTIASTVQTDGTPWLNPVGWTNLRPTFDELGVTRVYAKRLEAGDLGSVVKFYDDTSSGGAWLAFVDLVTNWYGEVTAGVAIASPTGYGAPHTTSSAQAGTNNPPTLLTPWAPSPTLYLTYRVGMVSTTGGLVDASSESRNPNGWNSNANFFLNATGGSSYDVALERALQNNSSGVGDPSPFTGLFNAFDYLETFTMAVRPYAGDPPPLAGGPEVESNNVASQFDHGSIVDHPDPASILPTAAAAATYNDYLLTRFDQDRPIVTFGFTATKSYHHRVQARTRRLSDRVAFVDSDEGVSGDFFIEAIRGEFGNGDRVWKVEYDLSPVLEVGSGADDNTDGGTGGSEPVTYLSVVDVLGTYNGSGTATVNNPDPTGVGNTLVFVSSCQGFGNAGTITWVAPTVSGVTVEDTLTNTTGEFWPQSRIWTGVNGGESTFTFGGTSSDQRQQGVVIALDGLATDVLVSGSFDVTGGAGPYTYPTVASTLLGDRVLAIMLQQATDQLTGGPDSSLTWTEEYNDTASTPNRIAVHSAAESADGSEDPGVATWSGTAGAKIGYTMAFRGSGGSGGGGTNPTAARINTANLLVDLDATDASTWGKNRTEGQWVVGGGRFNPGLDDNWNSLVWEVDNTTIDGAFTMEDGTDERLQQDTHNGVTVVHTAMQYVADGSYVYQSGQDNTSTNATTDKLYFDGNRSAMSHISIGIPVGPSADPTVVGCTFSVEPWMFANDYTTGPWELHDPGIYRSGPILQSIRSGTLSLGGKYTPTAIDPDDTSNIPTNWGAPSSVTLPGIGEWVTSIVEFVNDPGGTGYVKWYTLNHSTGELETVTEMGSNWGWLYDEADPSYTDENDNFYLILPQHYQFHQYTPAGISENWDLVGAGGSNVRRLKWPYMAASQSVTVEEMAGHAKYFLGIT
jgi:hypothetical protein